MACSIMIEVIEATVDPVLAMNMGGNMVGFYILFKV